MQNQNIKTIEFLKEVVSKFQTGLAIEHAYRPALEKYFKSITGLEIINDPKRSENGAPDFVFLNKKIVLAYAEAKDINVSLTETEKSEQMERYYGYSNMILTNCLEFRFYRNGNSYVEPIKIAELKNKEIVPIETNFTLLEDTLNQFINSSKEPIKSGVLLARVMAGKARRIRDNVFRFLENPTANKNENLLDIYNIIKKQLLPEIDHKKFADLYAQTLVYGLFVARYNDTTAESFTRQEARDLVPQSNPFLRHFFDHIAGPSFDYRIELIVNELCEEFTHADVKAIVHNFYNLENNKDRDPIIHFYEDFLQEYDPQERKSLGVFYTPIPVVQYIVKKVDEILKNDFGLQKGLSDSAKVETKINVQGKTIKVPLHRVQVLDPATGTGTFLNEIILFLKEGFKGQEGRWSSYVKQDLLPRLHGFELMMASYTIANLKLSTTFLESGVKIDDARLGIYLTNTLEKNDLPENLFSGIGFGKAITDELVQANKVKNDLPIMVVIGNPPYKGISYNNFPAANELVNKYKVEPGGKEKLKERNPKWLNDDYVKFIAFSENLIEKNENGGIMAFITNNSYLDNPTFRGMRWKLTQTFDKIFVIDLHGSTKKGETGNKNKVDENVFNIQQGVAIIIAVKKGLGVKSKKCEIYSMDLFGKKQDKFNHLLAGELAFDQIVLNDEMLYFKNKNFTGKDNYDSGFSVNEMFKISGVGITTAHDDFVIDESKTRLISKFNNFKNDNPNSEHLHSKYQVKKKKGWDILKGWNNLQNDEIVNFINPIFYRPFEKKFIIYEDKLVWRTVRKVMNSMINGENYALVTCRQVKSSGDFNHVFITKGLTESSYLSNKTGEIGNIMPLFVLLPNGEKVSNLNQSIVSKINKIIGHTSEESIFDYIYAVLNSVKYTAKYRDLLKLDFPRVPYPKTAKNFYSLAELGKQLREVHLFETNLDNVDQVTFPISGSDQVVKKSIKYSDGKVWINENQYFGGVSEIAWNQYIGGYLPAQRWLKDREGKVLTNEEIETYQHVIKVLSMTVEIKKDIDDIIDLD